MCIPHSIDVTIEARYSRALARPPDRYDIRRQGTPHKLTTLAQGTQRNIYIQLFPDIFIETFFETLRAPPRRPKEISF